MSHLVGSGKFSDLSMAYADKVILAPMVRMGTLPFRLLCLRYGADLVYSDEIVDARLLRCERIVNKQASSIDFVDDEGTVVFQTCAEERQKVILQLGTANPERALAAAKLVEKDVLGVDVNMGCPKDFSLKGGMGAALLRTPQLAFSILSKLVRNLSIPVTCKIRLLSETPDETIDFATQAAATGIAAIAVHGRLVSERPRDKNRDELISELVDRLPIPVICNGGSSEITSREDILNFRKRTRASSVMLARCVQRNPSLFRDAGVLWKDEIISDFLNLAARYNLCYTVCKYAVQHLYGNVCADPIGPKLLGTQSLEEICAVFGKNDVYQECMRLYWPKSSSILSSIIMVRDKDLVDNSFPKPVKRPLVADDVEDNNAYPVFEMPFKYFCKSTKSSRLPRVQLFQWLLQTKLEPPVYSVRNVGNLFFAEVVVEKKTFTSTVGHKNKKQAEQAAAFVALTHFDINKAVDSEGEKTDEEGKLREAVNAAVG